MFFSDLYKVLQENQFILIKMMSKPLYHGTLQGLDIDEYRRYEIVMINPVKGECLEIHI